MLPSGAAQLVSPPHGTDARRSAQAMPTVRAPLEAVPLTRGQNHPVTCWASHHAYPDPGVSWGTLRMHRFQQKKLGQAAL